MLEDALGNGAAAGPEVQVGTEHVIPLCTDIG